MNFDPIRGEMLMSSYHSVRYFSKGGRLQYGFEIMDGLNSMAVWITTSEAFQKRWIENIAQIMRSIYYKRPSSLLREKESKKGKVIIIPESIKEVKGTPLIVQNTYLRSC